MSKTRIRATLKKNEAKKSGRQFDPAIFLKTAANGRVISTHPEKHIIFAQGDSADSVFYIQTGKVKVTVVSPSGKEAVVAILGADEFFGEGCLIGQPKRLATAMALTECVTMRVQKSDIQRVLREESAFSQMFVSHILARNARVEEDLVDQLFNLANNYDVLTLEQQIDDLVVEITQQETTIRSLMADDHEVIDATTHLSRLIGKLTALFQTKVKPNMAAYSFLHTEPPRNASGRHSGNAEE